MRQLVGAPVQLPVGQRLVFKDHRTGIRGALNLGLDIAVQDQLTRVHLRRGVPRHQQALALRLGEQVQLARGLLRVGRQRL